MSKGRAGETPKGKAYRSSHWNDIVLKVKYKWNKENKRSPREKKWLKNDEPVERVKKVMYRENEE